MRHGSILAESWLCGSVEGREKGWSVFVKITGKTAMDGRLEDFPSPESGISYSALS
jgi:hypothetical protein